MFFICALRFRGISELNDDTMVIFSTIAITLDSVALHVVTSSSNNIHQYGCGMVRTRHFSITMLEKGFSDVCPLLLWIKRT